MKIYKRLKALDELNLSGLSRSAGIPKFRLIQAINESEYAPGKIRKLSAEELDRLRHSVSRLIIKLQKAL